MSGPRVCLIHLAVTHGADAGCRAWQEIDATLRGGFQALYAGFWKAHVAPPFDAYLRTGTGRGPTDACERDPAAEPAESYCSSSDELGYGRFISANCEYSFSIFKMQAWPDAIPAGFTSTPKALPSIFSKVSSPLVPAGLVAESITC